MLDLTSPTLPPAPPAPATGAHVAPAPARRCQYVETNTDNAMTLVPKPPAPAMASAADFPDDHWEEPTSNHVGSLAPQDVKPQSST
jgi:hypothetical protein